MPLKTGTPPRLMEERSTGASLRSTGDSDPTPFSFRTKEIPLRQISATLRTRRPETLRLIRENVHRSPMYTGQICGDWASVLSVDRG